jgi:hypothetical protein
MSKQHCPKRNEKNLCSSVYDVGNSSDGRRMFMDFSPEVLVNYQWVLISALTSYWEPFQRSKASELSLISNLFRSATGKV